MISETSKRAHQQLIKRRETALELASIAKQKGDIRTFSMFSAEAEQILNRLSSSAPSSHSQFSHR